MASSAVALLDGPTASPSAAVLTDVLLSVLGRGGAPLATLVVVAFVGGLGAGMALTAIIVVVVFVGYRRGMNPDDLVGPAMTTAGDVFGMLTLYLATRLALAVL